MKISIIAAALLSATAFAAPNRWGGNDGWKNSGKDDWNFNQKDGWKDDEKDCMKNDKKYKGPIPFTSTYKVIATPDQVVNGTEPTGGLKGAKGFYDLGINSDLNLICYQIRLINFRGDYESAADTATHVHEAARGQSGPPRLAFPNPKPVRGTKDRLSVGCLQGPFTTGITDVVSGKDTGANFHVSQIENNPAGFFADVHSSLAVPGAVRGQIA